MGEFGDQHPQANIDVKGILLRGEFIPSHLASQSNV
jgi:hypothetical protein